MRTFVMGVIFAAAHGAAAAQPPPTGCDSPESRQLDFWIGEWDLTYASETNIVHSRNRISKILDGCVIMEEFSGAPGSKLDGRSYSTYDRFSKQWKQTWVDNSAGYLDFVGTTVQGDMAFAREFEKDGRKVRQRMVFTKVTPESLKWLWQKSENDGQSWITTWEIDYKRVR